MHEKFIAVLTSDTHLTSRHWRGRPDVTGDSAYSWKQIFDIAREHGIPVVLAGDVFDESRPDSSSFCLAAKSISELYRDCGVHTYYVQGQHEYAAPPWLSAVEGAVHVSGLVCELKDAGMTIGGADYVSTQSIDDVIAKCPSHVDILVLHQLWREFVPRPMMASLSLNDLSVRADFVLTGDLHIHSRLKLDRFTALSPGSTCMRSIAEDPNKSVFLLRDDGKVVSRRLRTRPFVAVRLDSGSDFVQELAELRERLVRVREEFLNEAADAPPSLGEPIVVLHYPDFLSVAEIESRVSLDFVHWVWKPYREGEEPEEKAAETASGGVADPSGVMNCLWEASDGDRDVYESCVRLLKSPSPRKEIEKIVSEMTEKIDLSCLTERQG